jgi:hypothetical protein
VVHHSQRVSHLATPAPLDHQLTPAVLGCRPATHLEVSLLVPSQSPGPTAVGVWVADGSSRVLLGADP